MLRRLVIRFATDQTGATAIEYSLIGGMIALAIIASVTAFGEGLTALFGTVNEKAGNAISGASGG